MEQKTKWDWRKTLSKGLIVLGEIAVAGIISYIADKPLLMGLAPIFEIILDSIKHTEK